MELGREERFRSVAYALVRPVVHVYKQRLPVGSQRAVVDRETVVLAGNEAAVRTDLPHRLVMAAVPVFQLEDFGSSRLGQELVSHADAADGLRAFQRFPDVGNRRLAHVRVAGPVGNEKPASNEESR